MIHVRRFLSILLSLSLIMLPIGPIQASMIDNSQLFSSSSATLQRDDILQAMQRDEARQQLAALGISQEQAIERIQGMTDQEVTQINQRLADLPAGGDIIGVLLIIFIVFIITDSIGATDIFTFVHPVK